MALDLLPSWADAAPVIAAIVIKSVLKKLDRKEARLPLQLLLLVSICLFTQQRVKPKLKLSLLFRPYQHERSKKLIFLTSIF